MIHLFERMSTGFFILALYPTAWANSQLSIQVPTALPAGQPVSVSVIFRNLGGQQDLNADAAVSISLCDASVTQECQPPKGVSLQGVTEVTSTNGIAEFTLTIDKAQLVRFQAKSHGVKEVFSSPVQFYRIRALTKEEMVLPAGQPNGIAFELVDEAGARLKEAAATFMIQPCSDYEDKSLQACEGLGFLNHLKGDPTSDTKGAQGVLFFNLEFMLGLSEQLKISLLVSQLDGTRLYPTLKLPVTFTAQP